MKKLLLILSFAALIWLIVIVDWDAIDSSISSNLSWSAIDFSISYLIIPIIIFFVVISYIVFLFDTIKDKQLINSEIRMFKEQLSNIDRQISSFREIDARRDITKEENQEWLELTRKHKKINDKIVSITKHGKGAIFYSKEDTARFRFERISFILFAVILLGVAVIYLFTFEAVEEVMEDIIIFN